MSSIFLLIGGFHKETISTDAFMATVVWLGHGFSAQETMFVLLTKSSVEINLSHIYLIKGGGIHVKAQKGLTTVLRSSIMFSKVFLHPTCIFFLLVSYNEVNNIDDEP
ncbi:hypothetical protein ACJX0J_037845 [Zea mays]